MKTILLMVHDDAGQEARLQAALDLTRALSGHLTCVSGTMMPMVADDMVASGALAVLAAEETDRAEEIRARLTTRLEAEGLPFNWSEQVGELEFAVRDAARLCDVIVMNSHIGTRSDHAAALVTGDVVVDCARPVLAVPDDCKGVDFTGPALIAWDGSRASEAALRAAVPLLALAGRVVLFQIGEGADDLSAEQAAEYCSRHGIHAEIDRRPGTSAHADKILLAQAIAMRPAYVVMGGYGHARLAEAIFGGVTRTMLHECPVPLLLTH